MPLLLVLLGIFFFGVLLLVIVQVLFSTLTGRLDAMMENERARLTIGDQIIQGLASIESKTYRITPLQTEPAIGLEAGHILQEIQEVDHALDVIDKGGSVTLVFRLNLDERETLERDVSFRQDSETTDFHLASIELRPKLRRMEQDIDLLSKMLHYRIYLRAHAEEIAGQDALITNYVKKLAARFRRMKEDAGRLYYRSFEQMEKFRQKQDEQVRLYNVLQGALTVLIVLSVFAVAIVIARRILSDRHRLLDVMSQAKDAQAVAVKASKAKSELLANMSHELRTPLNAVIGYSEMMELKIMGEISDQYQEYAKLIKSSGLYLLGIINQILDLAKIEAGKMDLNEEEVFMGDLVDQVITLLNVRAKAKQIGLENHTDEAHTMWVDPVRIKQALFNIVGNAVKFTDQGGVTVFNRCDAAGHRIVVRDTGIGMSEADLKTSLEIFGQAGGQDPYVRTMEGTGLGLNLTQSIMELHGGKLEISSKLGEGTEVTLFFPNSRQMPTHSELSEGNPS